MRIYSLYYTHKPGGFCRRLYRLLNALAKAGHEVTYFTLDAPPAGALNPAIAVSILPFLFRRRHGLLFWLLFSSYLPVFCFWKARKRSPDRWVVFGPYYAAIL